MEKPKRKFLMSPYLLSLGLMLMIAVIGVTIKVVDICFWELRTFPPESGNVFESGAVKSLLFIILPWEFLLAFLLFRTYEVLGFMIIQRDKLLFKSLFRRKREIYYSEIAYIGIDYGVLSGHKQFWIIFSKEKIPPKYFHNINRMKLSSQTMRIQYSRKVFEALVFHLPKDLSKKLAASYSIIRLNKVEST